jgi:L-alanine-DL-glutamate epimerase-like enolase superfamily enzyme
VRDLLAEPFSFTNGRLRVPSGPGLGIELDGQVLERLRVR